MIERNIDFSSLFQRFVWPNVRERQFSNDDVGQRKIEPLQSLSATSCDPLVLLHPPIWFRVAYPIERKRTFANRQPTIGVPKLYQTIPYHSRRQQQQKQQAEKKAQHRNVYFPKL
ncbi:hypothetical protein BLOT_014729 [Blomia tropicalis]|nr:hypothetical protein BLOT_014729 [Blomia tropicalis]